MKGLSVCLQCDARHVCLVITGQLASACMLQKFKSWISHFVQSGFRLLHFLFFLLQHLWIPCTSLAKACIESHISSILNVCICVCICVFWAMNYFFMLRVKMTVQRWLTNPGSMPRCFVWTAGGMKRENKIGWREIEAWAAVMNPKSHRDCINACTWHSTQ